MLPTVRGCVVLKYTDVRRGADSCRVLITVVETLQPSEFASAVVEVREGVTLAAAGSFAGSAA